MYQRDAEKEEALWHQYWLSDQKDSSSLLQHYMPFASMLAKKQFKLLGFEQKDFDDFIQNANMGLLDAICRFDKNNGADFHIYASIRIKGSILNGIKSLSEKSQYHAYMKKIHSERRDSIVEHSDKTNTEVVGQLIVQLAYSHLLEELVEEGESEVLDAKESPYETYQLQQAKQVLGQYLKRLPEREQDLITWHYFEFMSFQEIAELFSISKGRVSQIHHQALQRLHTFCSKTPELIA